MSVNRIQKEVREMIRFLVRRALGRGAVAVAHERLEHAHWDRASRRWLTHVEAGEPAEPLAPAA